MNKHTHTHTCTETHTYSILGNLNQEIDGLSRVWGDRLSSLKTEMHQKN